MSVYILAQSITAVQTVTAVSTQGGNNQAAQPWGSSDNPNSPPQAQAFELVVTGTGSVSASAQIVASNDGVNWVSYGSALSATGTNTGLQTAAGTTPFTWFGAYITAISGTGAKATVQMSA